MSLSKAISACTVAILFGMAGASMAEASCGTRAIVLRSGMRGEIVRTLLTQHREEVKQELVRSGSPPPAPTPCFTCRENVPLAPVPIPANPSAVERSQMIDALLLPLTAPQFHATRGLLGEHSSLLYLLLDSPPPTPPPIG